MLRVKPRRVLTLSAFLILATVGTSCSSGTTTAPGGQAGQGGSASQSFKGVCPDTVVMQSDWWPQDEYAALYRLLGQNPQVDAKNNKVTGELVDNGVDTGVKLEIRSGGPANNYTPAASILYTDDSVMLGGADLDAAVAVSGTKPIVGVFAPMDISPVLLMWDPAQHPDFSTIADIGLSDTKVLYFQGSAYMDFLTGTGVLKKAQVSSSYAGTPDQWKASNGKNVQQGFLTNEVITYQEDKNIWGKKVSYQLISDAGYPVYPEMLTVRADKLEQYGPCLRKVVPALQRATVAYAKDPGPTNALMSDLVSKSRKAFPYTRAHADAATKAMLQEGIISNGPNKTVGDFDADRVRKIINIDQPIFTAQRTKIKSGLRPDEVATSQFIDPSIGLPATK